MPGAKIQEEIKKTMSPVTGSMIINGIFGNHSVLGDHSLWIFETAANIIFIFKKQRTIQ